MKRELKVEDNGITHKLAFDPRINEKRIESLLNHGRDDEGYLQVSMKRELKVR